MRKRQAKKNTKKGLQLGRPITREIIDKIKEEWMQRYKSPLEFLRTVQVDMQLYPKILSCDIGRTKEYLSKHRYSVVGDFNMNVKKCERVILEGFAISDSLLDRQ